MAFVLSVVKEIRPGEKRVALTPAVIALQALLTATSLETQLVSFASVVLGAANAAGGYVVTDRMLAMFHTSGARKN